MPKRTPPRSRTQFTDIEDLIERLLILAFKVATAIVVVKWLVDHVLHEFGR